MATGYHDFTAGETLTAANLEDFCMRQSVMIFASAAARDSALAAVLQEGMCAYLLDLNKLTVYTGAAWSTVGPVHGAWTSWTGTITQLGSVTCTNSYTRYQRIGRTVIGVFYLVVTGSGTAANAIIVGGLPFAGANAGSSPAGGSGTLFDSSTGSSYTHIPTFETTTTLALFNPNPAGAANPRHGVVGMSAALASGDVVTGTFCYEAAADA